MLKKKWTLLLTTMIVAAFVLGACQPQTVVVEKEVVKEVKVTEVVEVEKEVTKIVAGTPVVEIAATWQQDLAEFASQRHKVLLY